MFDDIGEKIKDLATLLTIIGILASVIIGIALMSNDLVFIGILIAILGSLFSWIGSFLLYGFGELVENSKIACDRAYEIQNMLNKANAKEEKKPQLLGNPTNISYKPISNVKKTTEGGWVCKKCETKNSSNSQFCKSCGEYK